jgi:hypothetical protein
MTRVLKVIVFWRRPGDACRSAKEDSASLPTTSYGAPTIPSFSRFPQLHIESYASMLLIAIVLFAANFFPARSYNHHGWPLTYMVREDQMDGDFTIYYGPWPFFDPPIRIFRSQYLGINILVCLALQLSAALAVEHFVRTYGRARFGIRSLFAVMTVTATALAFIQPGLVIEFLLFVFPHYFAYSLVCFCVFAFGHWLVVRRRCNVAE